MIAVKAILDLAKQFSESAAANDIKVDYNNDRMTAEAATANQDLI